MNGPFSPKNRKPTGALSVPEVPAHERVRHSLDAADKKDRLPANADEGDRAKFAKLRDHVIRLDEEVACKTCGKKFEIPSQQSLMFLDQLVGLPNEEELEREIAEASGDMEPAPEAKPALPARFTRKSTGWEVGHTHAQ